MSVKNLSLLEIQLLEQILNFFKGIQITYGLFVTKKCTKSIKNPGTKNGTYVNKSRVKYFFSTF